MIYGQDPITKEYLKINNWLNESDDNILLIIDNNIKNITLTPSLDPIKTKILLQMQKKDENEKNFD